MHTQEVNYYRDLIGLVSALFLFFFPLCGRSVSVRVSTWVVKAVAASRLMPACCIPRDKALPHGKSVMHEARGVQLPSAPTALCPQATAGILRVLTPCLC